MVDPELLEPFLHDGLDDGPNAAFKVLEPSPNQLVDQAFVAKECENLAPLCDALAGNYDRRLLGDGLQVGRGIQDAETFGEDTQVGGWALEASVSSVTVGPLVVQRWR